MLRSRQHAMLRSILRHEPVRRNAFTRRDIRGYVEAQAQPGALTSTINYYRAAFRYAPGAVRRVRRIKVPTLLIWGEHDRYLNPGYTQGLERWVPNLRVERIADASHWVQNDAPGRVNELMLSFLV
jgi:pimeloyl-ACP methyl ester carboxylesterase